MAEWKEFWRKVWFLFQKEFLATVKDPRSAAVLVLPIILQCLVFGYVANYNINDAPYVVLDHSRSKASNAFLHKLDGSGFFHRVGNITSEQEIAEYIDGDKVLLVVNIDRNFARDIAQGGKAKIQVITDGRNSTTAGLVTGYVNSVVASYNRELAGGTTPVEVITRVWYNENEITQWTFLTSITPMLCISQILLLAGLSVARERETGTFDQLLVTPLTATQILWGKALAPLAIGLIQCTLAVLICEIWFHIPLHGSVGVLYFTLTLFMLSIVGIGLCISAVSKTMQQVLVYCMVCILPINLLSGMSTPVHNMPQFLQYFTYLNPLRFAIDAVRRIYMSGATFYELIPDFIPMLLVAAVTLPAAGWMFRHKLN